MGNNVQKQWFEVLKFSNKEGASISKKKDICCIEASSSQEGYNMLIEQLAKRGYVSCEYFSQGNTYPRSIGQIINFIAISSKDADEIRNYWASSK
ncbi:hypothetical protein [uncultured Clostridium sp.]|uniref:hypothetical protein n=1 Tax=uncultured Clostridium sp. TaxID=59620 RepID=UPI002632EB9E|nr:hypothetical protein [uncultured Clostridium sp.]